MRNATLYFHKACFDGLVSATLARVFLEGKRWRFTDFIPVGYEARGSWLTSPLKTPAAIVDFLYHPSALFWADHHPTTFLEASSRDDFVKRRARSCLFFDENAAACASLLWRVLGTGIRNVERFREAVFWAEKIDSANYASVDEAIWGDSPALRIKNSLTIQSEPRYYQFLLTEMRSGQLDRIARLAPVSERFSEVRQRIRAGLERVKQQTLLTGEVAVLDTQSNDQDVVSRYAPYHFFPNARYSIGVLRSSSGIRITAMRNPWMNFRGIPLGKALEAFGGGGHERVGSVLIPSDHADSVREIVSQLISQMQSYSSVESVTA